MDTALNDQPELSHDDLNELVERARQERSAFIAAALEALVRRLRAPRPRREPAVTGRLGTC